MPEHCIQVLFIQRFQMVDLRTVLIILFLEPFDFFLEFGVFYEDFVFEVAVFNLYFLLLSL